MFLGEWTRWQDLALPPLPAGGLIVELGSGTGALATRAIQPGRSWLCVERSAPMVAVARERCRRAGVWLVRGDANALPIPDKAAAALVATFPSAYVLQAATHRELGRVVQPDGRLVVVLSGSLAPDALSRRWRRRLLGVFYGRPDHADLEPRPTLDFSGFAGSWSRLHTAHGTALVYVGRRDAATSDPVGASVVEAEGNVDRLPPIRG